MPTTINVSCCVRISVYYTSSYAVFGVTAPAVWSDHYHVTGSRREESGVV